MKKRIIPAIILFVIAIVIAIGSQTFLSPCIHEDGSFGTCHWAGQAVLGLGCVLAVQAILALCIRPARMIILFSAAFVCAVAGLILNARSK